MKRIGTVSYNIYGNFTNYGSALQTWALHQAIKKAGNGAYEPVLVDYCPDCLADKDPLNPLAHMWDQDAESKAMCERSLPAIRENWRKFDRFYKERFCRTSQKYTSENFNRIVERESLDGFLCGSDTIFCVNEFGCFDDGYYANYDCMKNGYTAAYAVSFGDIQLTGEEYQVLNDRLQNFRAIGLRESTLISYVRQHTGVCVKQVLDPTLLLEAHDYECMTAPGQEDEKYLLLYVRRYHAEMEAYAERLAAENGWKIIEISLRAGNAEKRNRRMFYGAGVEEFLSLVMHAQFVVTNSFHGVIFSVQYKRPFRVFIREMCNAKFAGLFEVTGISKQADMAKWTRRELDMAYQDIHTRIASFRKESFDFLQDMLSHCPGGQGGSL